MGAYAKAIAAGVVGIAATVVQNVTGVGIPEDTQLWISGLVTAALTTGLVYVIPNAPR